jgi:hypothetical protein
VKSLHDIVQAWFEALRDANCVLGSS